MRGLVPNRTAELFFFSALMSAGLLLLHLAHRLWFFGDDWDFLLERGVVGRHELGLFAPHNEHWSTVPILINRTLFSLFGVRHYLPYAAVVIVLHLAITGLMWTLLRRHGIRPWPAAVFGALLAVGGAGAENTLWDFQVGFLLPVLLALIAIKIMPTRSDLHVGRDLLVMSLCVLALMSSGQGIVAVVVVSLYAWLTRSLRLGGAFAVGGAVVYLSWYLAVGREGMHGESLGWGSIGAMPQYLWTGLANVWSAYTDVPQLGLLVIVVAVASLFGLRSDHASRHTPLAIAGLGGAFALFALTGATRHQLGLDQSLSSRYVYIAAVLTTPAVAAAVQGLFDRPGVVRREHRVVALMLTTLVLVGSVNSLAAFAQQRQQLLKETPETLIAAWRLVHEGAPLLNAEPEPQYTSNVTTDRLRRLRPSQLPDLGDDLQGRLAAASRLQVAVRRRQFRLPAADRYIAVGLPVMAGQLRAGCLRGTTSGPNAFIDLPVPAQGLQLALTTSDTHFATQLVAGDQLSGIVDIPTDSGGPWYIGSTAGGYVLRVIFPSKADFQACAI